MLFVNIYKLVMLSLAWRFMRFKEGTGEAGQIIKIPPLPEMSL